MYSFIHLFIYIYIYSAERGGERERERSRDGDAETNGCQLKTIYIASITCVSTSPRGCLSSPLLSSPSPPRPFFTFIAIGFIA